MSRVPSFNNVFQNLFPLKLVPRIRTKPKELPASKALATLCLLKTSGYRDNDGARIKSGGHAGVISGA